MSARPRRFSVCLGEIESVAARSIDAVSFEAAALAYAEVAHTGLAELRLIVRDLETGAERCFRLDMALDVADPS